MAANLETGAELRPTGSRLDLIQATVTAIAEHGLSNLTSAKIAGFAGHTAASVNFHFGGKEALLLATLREVSEEFAEVMASVQQEMGSDDRVPDRAVGARRSPQAPAQERDRQGGEQPPGAGKVERAHAGNL